MVDPNYPKPFLRWEPYEKTFKFPASQPGTSTVEGFHRWKGVWGVLGRFFWKKKPGEKLVVLISCHHPSYETRMWLKPPIFSFNTYKIYFTVHGPLWSTLVWSLDPSPSFGSHGPRVFHSHRFGARWTWLECSLRRQLWPQPTKKTHVTWHFGQQLCATWMTSGSSKFGEQLDLCSDQSRMCLWHAVQLDVAWPWRLTRAKGQGRILFVLNLNKKCSPLHVWNQTYSWRYCDDYGAMETKMGCELVRTQWPSGFEEMQISWNVTRQADISSNIAASNNLGKSSCWQTSANVCCWKEAAAIFRQLRPLTTTQPKSNEFEFLPIIHFSFFLIKLPDYIWWSGASHHQISWTCVTPTCWKWSFEKSPNTFGLKMFDLHREKLRQRWPWQQLLELSIALHHSDCTPHVNPW